VTSQIGQGSTFTVTLPKCAPSASQAVEQSPLQKHSLTHSDSLEQAKPPAQPLKVLYVEDNPANMRLMMEVVAKLDQVEIKMAPTAENGLKQARDWLPQLILLDINLPGMKGDEAVSKFRALFQEAASMPKLYAVTANVLEDQWQSYLKAGFDQVIAKPYDIQAMIEILMQKEMRLKKPSVRPKASKKC